MAGLLTGEPSNHEVTEGNYKMKPEEKPEEGGGRWYFSRKEIEENSPSRNDGIDLKKESHLRKSYCKFLQDLGMTLKVPQVTIATAIIFGHRFFLRQSHAKNDWRTIATACMFLAGKVEETPRPLKDVILVSYEIIHKKDAAAVQRIKQKVEVYEQQKELILLGEKVVLTTLGFDLNVLHPYKPLVEAIKKFKVAKNALAQAAWNFVNDGLRTSLCLQFKPHHIAAGAIFLAAKFLKVQLPTDPEKGWWREFAVTPRQVEEVSNQMLELYEQNGVPQSQASEAEGSTGFRQRPRSKGPVGEEHVASSSLSGASLKALPSMKPGPSQSAPDCQPPAEHKGGIPKVTQTRNNDYGISGTLDGRGVDELGVVRHHEQKAAPPEGNSGEVLHKPRFGIEGHTEDNQEGNSLRIESRGIAEQQDKYHGRNLSSKDGSVGPSPQDAPKKLDKEKLKEAFRRRKARGDITSKMDHMDELERELEDVEVPIESKRESKQSLSNSTNPVNHENPHNMKYPNEAGDGYHQSIKQTFSSREDFNAVEEGEVEPMDDLDQGYQSPRSSSRKRKGSPMDRLIPGSQKQNHHVYLEDRNGLVGRIGYSENNKRHLQENHA